jgi:hypothetical protein
LWLQAAGLSLAAAVNVVATNCCCWLLLLLLLLLLPPAPLLLHSAGPVLATVQVSPLPFVASLQSCKL